jgi:hypothetical protein
MSAANEKLDVTKPDYVSFFDHYENGFDDVTFQSLPRQIQDIIAKSGILKPEEYIDYRYSGTFDPINKIITVKPTEKVESREYKGSPGASVARKGGKSRSKKSRSKRSKRSKRSRHC